MIRVWGCNIVVLVVGIVGCLAQSSSPSSHVVPNVVNFGGTLADTNGKPLTVITGVTFSLYANPEGGVPLWLETQTVQPDKNGHYSVMLGSGTSQGLPSDLFASGEARWLGVQAQGQAELPRVMLLSVPYAMKAEDAETVGGLPPSAFARANEMPPGKKSNPTTETQNYIPLFIDNSGDLGNSLLYESGSTAVGIATTTPSATLEVNGTAKFDNLVGFASAQTFPGTLTGVTAGTGITVTGSKTDPTISINTTFANEYYPQLNAANTFTKSQTVQGTMTATTFSGSGSGLTNVNAAELGGLPPTAFQPAGSYATLGANTFTGNQSVSGNVSSTGSIAAVAANFTGLVTEAGSLLPATGTATPSQGYNSNAMDLVASSYNSTAAQAQNQDFRWLATPAGNNTGSPSGALSLLFGENGAPPTPTGLSIASNGQISFASNQTFPGAGTITGVNAGTGLSGGGNSGSVSLSLASNACSSGNALTALPFTCSPFATLGTNTFTGNQTVNGNLSLATGDSFNIGSNPIAFGTYSNSNAFLGFAGNSTMSGSANTAVGWKALVSNAQGVGNTGIGVEAVYSNTTGQYNTGTGDLALYHNISGSYNSALGYNAGPDANSTNLNNATAIGANAVVSESNALVLGGNGANSVNVGIATAVPSGSLHINGPYTAPPAGLPAGQNGLLLGTASDSGYKWIQSYGGPLAINPSGINNVGIGTTTPGHLLEVDAPATAAQIAMVSTGTDAAFSLKNTSVGGREYWIDSGGNGAGVGSGNFAIWDQTAGAVRFAVNSAGNIGIGTITPGATLEVNGTAKFDGLVNFSANNVFTGSQTFQSSNSNAVNATSSAPAASALVANETATSGGSYGVYAATNDPTGAALSGTNNSASNGNAYGVVGVSNGSAGTGVYGSGNGYGVFGANPNPQANNLNAAGIYGQYASESNSGKYVSPIAAGVWADGGTDGESGASGPAVIGTTDNQTSAYFFNNGVSDTLYLFNSSTVGQLFYAYNAANKGCEIDATGDLTCTGSVQGNVPIEGGARKVTLSAIESPKSWFEDFGSAQLSNGSTDVTIEPEYAQTVNTQIEYHVFLTPNGDCKGLYVSQRTPTSFQVRELGGGTSSIEFSYRIVALRKNYENIRLQDHTNDPGKQMKMRQGRAAASSEASLRRNSRTGSEVRTVETPGAGRASSPKNPDI